MCMADDGEYGRFSTHKDRKARKDHRCNECGRVIKRGETYRYFSGEHDGSIYTSKMCAHCQSAASLLQKECDGYLLEAVEEDLSEHIHELLPWSMAAARFVIAMRRQWQRFDKAGLMPVPRKYERA